jgi:hypothetical protein
MARMTIAMRRKRKPESQDFIPATPPYPPDKLLTDIAVIMFYTLEIIIKY